MTNFERITFGTFGVAAGILIGEGRFGLAAIVLVAAIASAVHRALKLIREDHRMTSPTEYRAESFALAILQEARARFLDEYFRRNPPANPDVPVIPQIAVTMSVPGMDFAFLIDLPGTFSPPPTVGDPPGGPAEPGPGSVAA